MAEGKGRSSGQGVKLLYIRDYLHKYTNKEHPKNATEISDYLASKGVKADRKTIYNDILRLQVDFQEPIEYNPYKKGYYIATATFSVHELQILADCVRTSTFLSSEEASSICKKIARLTNIYDGAQFDKTWTGEEPNKLAKSEIQNAQIIQQAIQQNRKISFRHFLYYPTESNRDTNGKVYVNSYTGNDVHIVSPMELTIFGGQYYLMCYITDSRIKRFQDVLFPLQYLEDITILPSERECKHLHLLNEEDLSPQMDYNAIASEFVSDEFYDAFFGEPEDDDRATGKTAWMMSVLISDAEEFYSEIFSYNHIFAIKLAFKREHATYILEEFGFDTVLVPADGEYCFATVKTKLSKHFFDWLFSKHGMVLIITPSEVQNVYIAYVSKVLKYYEYLDSPPSQLMLNLLELLQEKVHDPELLKALDKRYIMDECE